jgi:hypothetical protein
MIGADRELYVFRHVDDDRSRPAAGCDIEGLVQHLGEIVNIAHQPVVLGAGARDTHRVAFLERVVTDQMGRHLAGDADERNRVHQRIGERRYHVGGAGAGGHQHDAGLAGGARIAFCGVARALLVSHQDVLDLALLENLVIDRKHGAAGIAENVLHTMIDQRPHDHGGSRHLAGILACLAHGLLRIRRAWRPLRVCVGK